MYHAYGIIVCVGCGGYRYFMPNGILIIYKKLFTIHHSLFRQAQQPMTIHNSLITIHQYFGLITNKTTEFDKNIIFINIHQDKIHL